jgi:DNA-directed RNA polymerase subunit beta
MTERATFVINGIERAVVNQLVRSPVLSLPQLQIMLPENFYNAEIRPVHGAGLNLQPPDMKPLWLKLTDAESF